MSDLIQVDDERRAVGRPRASNDWYPESYPGEPEDITSALLRARDFLLQVVIRHRWLILAVTLVVFSLSAIQTMTTTPKYRATVDIQVDPQSANVLPYREITETGFQGSPEYLQTQIRAIRSRLLAERIIMRMNLPQNKAFMASTSSGLVKDTFNKAINWAVGSARSLVSPPQPSPSTTDETDSDLRDSQLAQENRSQPSFAPWLIGRFQNKLNVTAIPGSRILQVSYTSHDPQFAYNVLEHVAREYITLNLEGKHDTTVSASDFLENQLKSLQIKVESSEEELLEYARRHNILNYDDRENMVLRKLGTLNQQITGVEAQLSKQKAAYETLKDASVSEIPDALKNSSINSLERRLSQLQQELATLLTKFDTGWPEVVETKEEIADVTSQLEAAKEEAFLEAKQAYLNTLKEHENLVASLNRQRGLADSLNENLVQYKILKREADTNKELYEELLQRMKEASVSATLEPSNIRVLDKSGVPGGPYSPNYVIGLGMGAFGGLFLGLGLAVALVLFDNTLKTPEDVERILGLPSLGLIPTIRTLKQVGEKESAVSTEVLSPRSGAILSEGRIGNRSWEPYRSLRTSILLSNSDKPPKTILVTSPLPSEGKSTTSLNLAIVLAQTGASTVLVDLDMRRSGLGEIFHLSGGVGMSVYLSGNVDSLDNIHQTSFENLSFIPAGKEPPNPAELIGSRRMNQLLKELKDRFDFVVIDSPPVLACTDSVVLSPRVDGVVLVCRGGSTPRKAMISSTDTLYNVGAKILGVVINDVDLEKPEYAYYYGDYYQHYHYYHREVS